jgi:hypothetical protein
VDVAIDEARDQRPSREIDGVRARAFVHAFHLRTRSTARIFPSFTASASAVGCASFTVTMSPPV